MGDPSALQITGHALVRDKNRDLVMISIQNIARLVLEETGLGVMSTNDVLPMGAACENQAEIGLTIEQRRRTMVKVMECISRKQRAFFEKGTSHLRPLTLQQVASAIQRALHGVS